MQRAVRSADVRIFQIRNLLPQTSIESIAPKRFLPVLWHLHSLSSNWFLQRPVLMVVSTWRIPIVLKFLDIADHAPPQQPLKFRYMFV